MWYQYYLGLASIIYLFIFCHIIDVTFGNEDGYILTLEHAFGNDEYLERAKLYFPSIRGERAVVSKQTSMSKNQHLLLEQLSKNNGIYKIRVKSKLSPATSVSETNEAVWLTSYSYAKLLEDSNFCDDIVIYTDGLGNLIAINIAPSVGGSFAEFTTNLTVVMPGLAPVPDTVGYFNKIEDERRRKEKAASEPQSFFSKYWMYILPMVVFMMVQSAAQQPQQG